MSRTGGGESCEEVLAEYEAMLQRAPPQAPGGATTPTSERFAPGLSQTHHFAECEIPLGMQVFICVAIREGVPKGVTVETVPPTRGKAECVVRMLRSLEFPRDQTLDITHVDL